MTTTIPVFRPKLARPPAHLLATLQSSWWGTGPQVEAFEQEFGEMVRVDPSRCLMLNSCTAALHLAVKLHPDAERFLLPALTFVSTGLAPQYERKQVRFVEIGDDLCIDQEDALRKAESPRDVVIAVHLGGHLACLGRLERELRVIEDCAHALGSYERFDVHAGTVNAGCFSFQATKGLPIGDGGMLVLPEKAQRGAAEAWAWCGIGQSTWDRSASEYRWAYSIDCEGYKYRANDVMAALARDQIGGVGEALARRRALAAAYDQALAGLPWLRLPEVRPGTWPSRQEYIVRTARRDDLQRHLAGRGISTTVHYYPIHLYPIWGEAQQLPFTEKVWREILTIPCFADLTEEEQERVVEGVRSFRP